MHPMSAHKEPNQQRVAGDPHRARSPSRSIDSQTLFGDADTLHIHHLGLTYTLRKTRNGKLILNK